MTDKEGTPATTRDREGIDGWLLLWAINLSLLFPIAVYGLWVVPVLAVREHPLGLPIAALLYGVLFCLFGLFAATRFFRMGTRYPIPCIAVFQPGGYVAGILDALGPCGITHLGDALWRRLSEAISWRD